MKRASRIVLALAIFAGVAAVVASDESSGPLSTPDLRTRALALCGLYLPCNVGDAHCSEIAKDFGGKGSRCGYLPGWMLWRLGCRDGRIVNRAEPQAGLVYRDAKNIEDLVKGGKALGCWREYHLGQEPEPGDILYFQDSAFIAGTETDPHEHVAICVSCPPGGTGELVTFDLGHFPREGDLVKRQMVKGVVAFLGTSKTLVGIDNLSMIPMTAPPDLTDHTRGAIA